MTTIIFLPLSNAAAFGFIQGPEGLLEFMSEA
jgi:hypothetical protein